MMTGWFPFLSVTNQHFVFLHHPTPITGEALADIVDATTRLVSTGASTPADTLQRLLLLASLPRFKMLLMFLEHSSIAALRVCIASADSAADLKETQEMLRQQWGLS
jgi:hypothetical protein